VSAVGHYLEEEGIPTVSISLVREHSEAMRPPRALWVPFLLGRPVGVPDQPEFQRRVVRAALELFEVAEGPVVLRDFPEDAPPVAAGPEEMEGMVCPLARSTPAPDPTTLGGLGAALHEEIDQLRAWYDLNLQRRGGSAFGLSGLAIEALADRLCAILGQFDDAADGAAPELELRKLKLAGDDLRTWYEEAAAAQPGGRESRAVRDWYYERSVAGHLLRRLRARLLASPDPRHVTFGTSALVPRVVAQRWAG